MRCFYSCLPMFFFGAILNELGIGWSANTKLPASAETIMSILCTRCCLAWKILHHFFGKAQELMGWKLEQMVSHTNIYSLHIKEGAHLVGTYPPLKLTSSSRPSLRISRGTLPPFSGEFQGGYRTLKGFLLDVFFGGVSASHNQWFHTHVFCWSLVLTPMEFVGSSTEFWDVHLNIFATQNQNTLGTRTFSTTILGSLTTTTNGPQNVSKINMNKPFPR